MTSPELLSAQPAPAGGCVGDGVAMPMHEADMAAVCEILGAMAQALHGIAMAIDATVVCQREQVVQGALGVRV